MINRITIDNILGISFTNQVIEDDEYLHSVKTMNYHMFLNIMKMLSPDIGTSQLLSDFYTEYIVFKSTELDKKTICDIVDEYPICINEKNGSYQFQGLSPFNIPPLVSNKIIYLPIIIELDGDEFAHQMTFIINFESNIVFVHNPNGDNCRCYNSIVKELFVVYVSEINCAMERYLLKHITFVNTFEQAQINYQFNGIDDGHCVVASIVYMMAYKIVGNVNTLNQVLFHTSKKEYKNLYTVLYNLIGSCLLRQAS
jgi:hypothetical protein